MANTRSTKTANQLDKEGAEALAEQTAKFLESGGKIQHIPSGVSGQVQTTGPRHITLGKRHQTTQS